MGKPVELAGQYYIDGADEVCYIEFKHILIFYISLWILGS